MKNKSVMILLASILLFSLIFSAGVKASECEQRGFKCLDVLECQKQKLEAKAGLVNSCDDDALVCCGLPSSQPIKSSCEEKTYTCKTACDNQDTPQSDYECFGTKTACCEEPNILSSTLGGPAGLIYNKIKDIFGDAISWTDNELGISKALGLGSWNIFANFSYHFGVGLVAGLIIGLLGFLENAFKKVVPSKRKNPKPPERTSYLIMVFVDHPFLASIVLGLIYSVLNSIPVFSAVIKVILLTAFLGKGVGVFFIEAIWIAILVGVVPAVIKAVLLGRKKEQLALAEMYVKAGAKMTAATAAGAVSGTKP